MTFQDFGFDEKIQKGIDEAGFTTPMPVQAQCFDLLIKEHRDIYAQSQTGTGKTAAFLLGIFQLLQTEEKYKGQKALIVVPTRELAVQIEREGKKLAKYLDYKIGAIFGGVGYAAQEKMLAQGVDVLIGTPGRLLDFSKQRKINMKEFGFLVIDEADRLFDMGFLPDLRRILKVMRPYNERHTLLFSATMNARVGNLAWEYMNDPGEVIIEPEKMTVDTVSQELYHVGKDEKMKLLLGLLKRDNPENAVIFTNTRHSTWEVAKRLEVNGYSVVFLMGDLPQSKRLRITDDVKKGKHKFLVATDVAARGLHIDDLEMVINYDVPLEAESYVHRIGRTARAGREGKTVTMACEEYVYGLGPIEKLLGQKIPVSWAEETLFAEDSSEGMRFAPRDRYRDMGGEDKRDGQRGRDRRERERSSNRDRQKTPHEKRPPQASRQEKSEDKRGTQDRRGPSRKKKPLDPRVAQIQSTVSSIAGGSLDDFENTTRSQERKPQSRNEKRRPRQDKRSNVPRPQERMTEARISADSSMEERLAYYRKKYGEDFKMEGVSSSPSGKKSPQKKRPQNKRRSNPQRNAKPNHRNNGPVQKKQKPQPAQKAPAPPKVEDKKPVKKGFFQRLFGKK